jgi:DNA replication and repair protein RecF
MAIVSFLGISKFRNLKQVEIKPNKCFNVVYGANGSGKTSLLEAIYHLSLARSFRTRLFNRVIQYGSDKFSIFSEISSISVGLERHRDGNLRIRIAGKEIYTSSKLTNILPLQLINQDSYQLIDAGAKTRRQFINWGVFHVKPDVFLESWNKMKRILKQRNAALKKPYAIKEEIILWDKELVKAAYLIKEMKIAYIGQLANIVSQIIMPLLAIEGLNFTFYAGWDEKKGLQEVLHEGLTRDMQLGYTQYGPHRADLRITVEKIPAQDVLSRGQKKILVCVMKLAQAILLQETAGKKCVLLFDDLVAELDEEKRKQICKIIAQLELQTFITGTDIGILQKLFNPKETSIFQMVSGSVV